MRKDAVCVCEGELTSLGLEKLDLFYSAHPLFPLSRTHI